MPRLIPKEPSDGLAPQPIPRRPGMTNKEEYEEQRLEFLRASADQRGISGNNWIFELAYALATEVDGRKNPRGPRGYGARYRALLFLRWNELKEEGLRPSQIEKTLIDEEPFKSTLLEADKEKGRKTIVLREVQKRHRYSLRKLYEKIASEFKTESDKRGIPFERKSYETIGSVKKSRVK